VRVYQWTILHSVVKQRPELRKLFEIIRNVR